MNSLTGVIVYVLVVCSLHARFFLIPVCFSGYTFATGAFVRLKNTSFVFGISSGLGPGWSIVGFKVGLLPPSVVGSLTSTILEVSGVCPSDVSLVL